MQTTEKLISDYLKFTDRKTISAEDVPSLIWNLFQGSLSPAHAKNIILQLMEDYPINGQASVNDYN